MPAPQPSPPNRFSGARCARIAGWAVGLGSVAAAVVQCLCASLGSLREAEFGSALAIISAVPEDGFSFYGAILLWWTIAALGPLFLWLTRSGNTALRSLAWIGVYAYAWQWLLYLAAALPRFGEGFEFFETVRAYLAQLGLYGLFGLGLVWSIWAVERASRLYQAARRQDEAAHAVCGRIGRWSQAAGLLLLTLPWLAFLAYDAPPWTLIAPGLASIVLLGLWAAGQSWAIRVPALVVIAAWCAALGLALVHPWANREEDQVLALAEMLAALVESGEIPEIGAAPPDVEELVERWIWRRGLLHAGLWAGTAAAGCVLVWFGRDYLSKLPAGESTRLVQLLGPVRRAGAAYFDELRVGVLWLSRRGAWYFLALLALVSLAGFQIWVAYLAATQPHGLRLGSFAVQPRLLGVGLALDAAVFGLLLAIPAHAASRTERRENAWSPWDDLAWYYGRARRLNQSLATMCGYSLAFAVAVLLITNVRGCAEVFELPGGGGEQQTVSRTVKIQKVIRKKFVINPFSNIVYRVPPIDDVKLHLEEVTQHLYKIGDGQGEGAGLSGGTGRGKVRFIRVRYNGGDWEQDRAEDSDLNLLVRFGELTGWKVAEAPEDRTIAQVNNFRKGASPPLVYLTGQRNIQLSKSEVKDLREYLVDKHGMLFIDNGGSMHFHNQAFAMMREVLPNIQPVRVPLDDPIHRVPFAIPFLPYVAPHGGKEAWGWKNPDDGRWLCYYHPGDIGDAWANGNAGVSRTVYEACYQLGANVFNYAYVEYNRWLKAQLKK